MNGSEIKCFVGHVFSREQMDDLRRAIGEAFVDYPHFSLWFADDYYTSGHILGKIQGAIDESLLCIFELSHQSKPNVFVELGYALGNGKTCLLLVKKGSDLASDLAGLDRIEYESMTQLTQRMKKYLPQAIGQAVDTSRVVGKVDTRVMSFIPSDVVSGNSIDVDDLAEKARAKGFPETKVMETLRGLESADYVTRSGGAWIVTETGASCIPQLVELARDSLR